MQRYGFMLAKSGDKDILNRKSLAGFIFEPYFSGIRVLIYKEGNDIEIIDTFGQDITFRFPELLEIPRNFKTQSCVLDAELIIFDKENKLDFNALQKRSKLSNKEAIYSMSKKNPAIIFVFDILEKDGHSLTDKFLEERKRILNEIIINARFVSLCPYMANSKEMWKQIQEKEIEVMMVKELNSVYEQGKRSWAWLKIKNLNTTDAIIAGFTKKEGNYFNSLILSSYIPENGRIIYIGTISNFDKSFVKRLTKKIKRLVTDKQILDESEKSKIQEDKIIWIKPKLIIKVKYSDLTQEKTLENPEFIGLRFDKKIQDCILS